MKKIFLSYVCLFLLASCTGKNYEDHTHEHLITPTNYKQKFSDDFYKDVEVSLQSHCDIFNKLWSEHLNIETVGIHWSDINCVIEMVDVEHACGGFAGVLNPLYCAADDSIYISPLAYDLLDGAVGDKPIIYILAHEFAHAVQWRIGFLSKGWREQRGELGLKASRIVEATGDCMASYIIHYGISQGEIGWTNEDFAEVIIAAHQAGCSRLNCTHPFPADRARAAATGFSERGLSQCQIFSL